MGRTSGCLPGRTLCCPCLPDIVFRIENWRLEGWMDDGWMGALRSRRSAAKTLDKLQLVPDLDPAMTYLSGWQFQNAMGFQADAGNAKRS